MTPLLKSKGSRNTRELEEVTIEESVVSREKRLLAQASVRCIAFLSYATSLLLIDELTVFDARSFMQSTIGSPGGASHDVALAEFHYREFPLGKAHGFIRSRDDTACFRSGSSPGLPEEGSRRYFGPRRSLLHPQLSHPRSCERLA